ELRTGQSITTAQLIQRLNDVGYARRQVADSPGEFATDARIVSIVTRGGEQTPSRAVQVSFTAGNAPTVARITEGDRRITSLTLEAPLLAALSPGERRRHVALGSLPPHVINAVLAIEDRRFFDHPGVDP